MSKLINTLFIATMGIMGWILFDKVTHGNMVFLMGLAIGIIVFVALSRTRPKSEVEKLRLAVWALAGIIIIVVFKDLVSISKEDLRAAALGLVSSGLIALAHHANRT